MTNLDNDVLYEVRDRVAIITLNRPKSLNALTQAHYFRVGKHLRAAAEDENVVITVITGRGRFFSAGADVRARAAPQHNEDVLHFYNQTFAANNREITSVFASHPKILVAALNGPVVGLSAALAAHADFIYATPHTYLLVPFSSLGLVSEGGAAKTFPDRMGIAKANEALIMSKRITCEELVQTGFVNQVFQVQPGEDKKFLDAVLHEVNERLGSHLVKSSLMEIKRQIRKATRREIDLLLIDEVQVGLDRFAAGIPQQEFAKVASGKKRHKL